MAHTRTRILICFSLILFFMGALTLLVFSLSHNIWLAAAASILVGIILAIPASGIRSKGDGNSGQSEALHRGNLAAGGNAGKYLYQMVDEVCTTLDAIATGDLSVTLRGNYTGDYKQLAKSLNNVLATLNDCMADISCTIGSAYTYSKGISEASLQLAENATDQAVSIANLSQSMALVAERAIHSTTLARSMTDSSEHVMLVATSTEQQMDNLLQSMQDINEAGRSIENVIRIMDDIAFRTNILALNAATAATRAGQQDTGFSMVAEEVRQLASQSAYAAQQSKQLIFNTINKVDEGYNISLQIHGSMGQIVAGVQDVNNSIGMISRGSDTQEHEIKVVNSLLEELAKSVSQGSSGSDTAAEYGRGLEECAGQLGQMAQRFLLDETHTRQVRESRKQLVAIRPTAQLDEDSVYKHLIWDDSLKMGNDLIDGQHKQLIEMVDRLLASCFNGTAADEVNKAMSFVLDYTVRHFADEEKLQLKCGFPGYRHHKQLHNAFKQKALVLSQMLEKNGPSTEMVGIINRELVDWLLNHIKVEDKKISQYLRK